MGVASPGGGQVAASSATAALRKVQVHDLRRRRAAVTLLQDASSATADAALARGAFHHSGNTGSAARCRDLPL
jgi:hypothetical protein